MSSKMSEYVQSWAQIQKLVADGIIEDTSLDFKSIGYADPRKQKDAQEQDKTELRRDATAFANAGGGMLLIGVQEDAQGRAGSVKGIDQAKKQEDFIRDVLSRHIDPPLNEFRVWTVFDLAEATRGVVVVNIAACEAGLPHAVHSKNDEPLDFWIRSDKSKRRMDYLQIRASFRTGEKEAERQRLDTAAMLEITKTKYAIRRARWDFERMLGLLKSLEPYVEGYEFGRQVHSGVLEAAGEVLDSPRVGLTVRVAREAVQIVERTLPIYSHVSSREDALADEEITMFRVAASYGHGMVYDGIKYLQDLAVIGVGGQLLGRLLQAAHLNNWREVEENVLGQFRHTRQTAEDCKNHEALRLLGFFEADALADRKGPLVPLPKGLEWVIFGKDGPSDPSPRGLRRRRRSAR